MKAQHYIKFSQEYQGEMVILIYSNFYQILNKMAEKRAWTPEEDRILKYVFQTSKLPKWSHIARKLCQDYGIKGRNGKQCKERYITHIDTSQSKYIWTRHDQQKLIELHNELGNKWAIIGQQIGGRTDNSVKNHFYSLLRKALRKVNIALQQSFRTDIKQFKPAVMYHIVEVSDERIRDLLNQDDIQFSQFSNQLKNQLFSFSYDQMEDQQINTQRAKELINKMSQFGLRYKKKGKRTRKASGQGQNLLKPNRFQPRRSNTENEESESSNVQDGSNLEDISDDQINRSNNDKSSRRLSYNSLNGDQLKVEEPLILTRSRTRSQGNFREKFVQQNDFKMQEESKQKNEKDKKVIKASNSLELQSLLEDYNILQACPDFPLSLNKRESLASQDLDRNKQREEFHFFEDSQIEMRILPEIEVNMCDSYFEEDYLL